MYHHSCRTINAGIIAEGSGNDGGLAAGAEGIGLKMLPQGVESKFTEVLLDGICQKSPRF